MALHVWYKWQWRKLIKIEKKNRLCNDSYLKSGFTVMKNKPQCISSVDEKALLASYRVTFRVAKAGKPHTDAENLILPAALDMVEIMLDKQEANKLKSISLSDNNIERRINDMTGDIREQLAENLKKSPHFALQFDESTDVSECAQFISFVHFEADETIMEDILFC
ncbi:protein FAM200A-like [Schistocerca piceifrons]|uniref:protein FAM200A-like n=1 Tax=Schistocerca piceifrons TaxID=274613 RepID=UPI001F5F641A|nr:protein FAM200A-like [Schistocerca piceifrons]